MAEKKTETSPRWRIIYKQKDNILKAEFHGEKNGDPITRKEITKTAESTLTPDSPEKTALVSIHSINPY